MNSKYQKVAYYPGCALEGTGHAYNASTKAVGKALGLGLEEVKDWNCCGAMEVKNVDPKVQTYLSSRVLSIAANEMRHGVVMAPCNGCYHNLKKAEHDLAHDEGSRQVVERISRKAGPGVPAHIRRNAISIYSGMRSVCSTRAANFVTGSMIGM